MLLALTAVSSLAADSRAHAATAMFIGLLISMIGIDLQTSVPRLTFTPELLGGIDVVLAAVGLLRSAKCCGPRRPVATRTCHRRWSDA